MMLAYNEKRLLVLLLAGQRKGKIMMLERLLVLLAGQKR